jgi:hypothetical protein
MGEMPDGTFEPDTPPLRGGHPQWWMDLTPEQRVTHYNRTKPSWAPLADINSWPDALREAFSFDPYFNTPNGPLHDVKKFFTRSCDCIQCRAKIGWGKNSDFKFH